MAAFPTGQIGGTMRDFDHRWQGQRCLTYDSSRRRQTSGVASAVRPRRKPRQSDPEIAGWFPQLPYALLLFSRQGDLQQSSNVAAKLMQRAFLSDTEGQSAWLERLRRQLMLLTATSEQNTPVRLDECSLRIEGAPAREIQVHVNRWPDARGGFSYLCLLQEGPQGIGPVDELVQFFELSLDLFCIADFNGHFCTINANFSQRLGYSDHELTGQTFLAFIHPEDIAGTKEVMERLRVGESVIAFRNRYRDVRGNYHWFEWTARAVEGRQVIYASARDVTRQVETETQLRLQEQREHAILDNTSAVIYVKDAQGRYQFVNREFSRVFHVSQEIVTGKTDFDLFPDRVATQFHQNDCRVLESGCPITMEEVAPHSDGHHNYLSIKFPLFDTSGETVSVAGISTDISDRVWLQRTQEELRLAQQVQRRLFPAGELKVPGFDIHGKVLAASHLCGDFFDYVLRPDGQIVCCIADVSGHGLAPALAMVETRAMLRMLLKESHSLPETISVLNRLLYEDMLDSSFVTLLLAELDPEKQQFSYVGAGHDATLLRSNGTVERLGSTGPILGVWNDACFKLSPTLQLSAGDLLLMCTDGVGETLSPEGELFGFERICQTLTHCRELPAGTILEELFAIAHAYSREPLPRDDMTAIAIKVL